MKLKRALVCYLKFLVERRKFWRVVGSNDLAESKRRRLVFSFRLTSQRKEQMIHSRIHQSHDALQFTASSDKADKICITTLSF